MSYSPIDSPPLPPIGAREGLQLEFKRLEKLRDKKLRRDLARSVVALRNAEGGALWIGAREEREQLVGWETLPPEEYSLRDALRDVLVDLVEPALRLGSEVRLDLVPVGAGSVLCVQVRERLVDEPYACVLNGNAREFLRRTDSRTEAIPHGELFTGAANRGRATEARPDLRDTTWKAHREWWESSMRKQAGLVVSVCHHSQSAREPEEAVSRRRERWKELVESPTPRLARPGGSTWTSKAHTTRIHRESLDTGHDRWGILSRPGNAPSSTFRILRIDENGNVHFFLGAEHLLLPSRKQLATQALQRPIEMVLHPHVLVETVASTIRLAAELMRDAGQLHVDQSAAVVSLEGLRGATWPLLSVDPSYHQAGRLREEWVMLSSERLRTRVQLVTPERLRDQPDAISYQLLHDLYESDPDRDSHSRAPLRIHDIPWFPTTETFSPPA
jgi:hypothetical protein